MNVHSFYVINVLSQAEQHIQLIKKESYSHRLVSTSEQSVWKSKEKIIFLRKDCRT